MGDKPQWLLDYEQRLRERMEKYPWECGSCSCECAHAEIERLRAALRVGAEFLDCQTDENAERFRAAFRERS